MGSRRIGPRMREVAAIARYRPGIVQQKLALALTYANGGASNQYGTRAVERTLVAGLIELGNCADAQCARPGVSHRHYWATGPSCCVRRSELYGKSY